MKFGKLLLAIVGATVLLGALVTLASASHLEYSSQTNRASWIRMYFRGGFGTVECEVVLSGSFHSRSIAKFTQLIGYITAATVTRCTRGGATVNQGSLPWHRVYRGFSGFLPNITSIEERVDGAEWTIREPTFGISCTVNRAESRTIGTYGLTSGVVTTAAVSGTSPCGSFSGTLEGSTERVEDGALRRLTILLI